MTRYLCWVAVLGVVAIPDWAAACRPGWGPPVYAPACYPAYGPPVYQSYPVCPQYALPPSYVCPPAPCAPLAPPRIESIPKSAVPAPAPAPGGNTSDAGGTKSLVIPAAPPKLDVVRPVAGSETNPVTPKKSDAPVKVDAGAKTDAPQPFPDFPNVVIPKELGPLPKLDVPKEPDFRPIPGPKITRDDTPKGAAPVAIPEAAPKLPSIDLSKDDGFKLPPIELPKDNGFKLPPIDAIPKDTGPKLPALPGAGGSGTATPSAAPAPAMPDALIPPPAMPLPDARKPDGLPGLTLPPIEPVAPAKPDITVRSSPLTGGAREMTVNVVPAKGTEQVLGGYRNVNFYNYTARELSLTIEGQTVKLPAKNYVNTKLAATFTWSHGDRAAVRETVPTGSSGVDVVFRE